jgi:TatD DNase family protein
MRFIDTHVHLDFPEFDKNRKEVIARAVRGDVGIINSCLDKKGFELMRGFKEVFLTIGCTPYELEDFQPQYELIRAHMDDIIAVGEVGLDYYWVKEEPRRARERENLLKFMDLAKEHDKPLVIHSRNAEKPCLDLLEKSDVRALMHCFSGSMGEAARAIDLGYPISIPANINRSKQKQEFARSLPLDSLVLETDAPYLAPDPGSINEPINVIKSAALIAELRGVGIDEVARVTTKNAREFFGI